jgi:hypothetical protein
MGLAAATHDAKMRSKDVPAKSLDEAASPILGHCVEGNIASRIPLKDEVLTGISVSRRRTRRYQLSHLTSYQFQEMRGMLAASPGPGHVLDTIGT